MRIPVFSTLFFLITNVAYAQFSSKSIMDNMFQAINNVETLKFKLKKEERVKGILKHGEQDVKFQRKPKKIYTYIHKPNPGVELLWLEGKNGNKAYINPNGFPYINVSLDPYGSNMRKGNHHTVHEVGFDYIGGILSRIYKESKSSYEMFDYRGTVTFDGRDCLIIEIDYKPFKYIDYVVKEGETLVDIAYNNFISDYMILEKNPHIKEYDGVKAGQKISIPNAYARKTVLYVDKKSFLPIVQRMYDEKGLYEQYEFYNLEVNSPIKQEEFTEGYKEYNF